MRSAIRSRPAVALLGALLAVAALGVAAPARAQVAPTPKPAAPKPPVKGQTVEVRGQAPTPQVVTVRPRAVPHYLPAALPGAMVASGAWGSATAGYAMTPANQLAGRLPLDTSAAGIARGGALVKGAAVAVGAAAGAEGGAPAGASAAEIEQMRRELATRKSRLDSLQEALRQNEDAMRRLGPLPDSAGGAPLSGPDAAARAAEIAAIRRELEYRRMRLDSLQKEVNSIGEGDLPVRTDSTPSPSGTPPPRAPR